MLNGEKCKCHDTGVWTAFDADGLAGGECKCVPDDQFCVIDNSEQGLAANGHENGFFYRRPSPTEQQAIA